MASPPQFMTNDEPLNLCRKDLELYPKALLETLRTGKRHPLVRTSSDCLAAYGKELDLVSDERTLQVPITGLGGTRALDQSSGSTGGYLVGAEVERVARVLRPFTVCLQAGATLLTGLQGNVVLGREVAESTFNWYHSQDTVTSSDGNFGQVGLSPHRVAALTGLTKQLKYQVGVVDIQQFKIDSLLRGAGVALDRGALAGGLNVGEPLGAYYMNGATVTFGASATWAKAVNFQRQILDANGRLATLAFCAPPNVREKWQTISRFTSGSASLWGTQGDLEEIAGSPAYVTTSMPANSIMCGDFSTMFIGLWGPNSMEVIIDPFSSKRSETIELQCTLYCDVGITQPAVWIRNADSAVQ